MAIIGTFLLLLSFTLGVFTRWFDASLILQYCALFAFVITAYISTPFKHIKTKLSLLVSSCLVATYLAIIVLMLITNQHMLDSLYLAMAILAAILLVRTVLLSFNSKDKYARRGTFLAYKKPKSLQGYIAALVWGYASVSLVINGTAFKFKKGVFVSSDHASGSNYIYKRIESIPAKNARLMLGKKWKWYKNCFTLIIGDISNGTYGHAGDYPRDIKERGTGNGNSTDGEV